MRHLLVGSRSRDNVTFTGVARMNEILALVFTLIILQPASGAAENVAHSAVADENCRKKLTELIEQKAKAEGLQGEIGVQFYENEPFVKAGFDAQKRQLHKYTTPPFMVDEGYIPESKAIAVVRFTDKSCEIVKLTVNTGGFQP